MTRKEFLQKLGLMGVAAFFAPKLLAGTESAGTPVESVTEEELDNMSKSGFVDYDFADGHASSMTTVTYPNPYPPETFANLARNAAKKRDEIAFRSIGVKT